MGYQVIDTPFSFMSRHIIILLLPIVILAVFYNSLNGTWAMDDAYISNFLSAPHLLSLKADFRKVSYLSFYLNSLYLPQEAFYYRLVNLFFHSLNSILVYIFAFLAFVRFKTIKKPVLASFIVALIFALHPINNTSVVYIIQRMTLLSAFFVLLSIIFYIKAEEEKRPFYSISLKILSLLMILFGVFAKENALVAIPLIILYITFFSDSNILKSKGQLFIIIGITMVLIITFYLLNLSNTLVALIRTFLHPFEPIRQEGWTAIDVYWTPAQHFLTETRVLMDYLLSIFMPLPQLFVFDSWGYPISESLLKPISTLFSSIIFVILMFVAIKYRKYYPLLSFAILWFFLAISLESFIAVGSDLYFEHRNYIPLIGLLIGLIGHISSNEKVANRAIFVLIPFIVLLIFTTIKRNEVFHDSISLWNDTIQKAPYNLRAKIALGNAYFKNFQVDKAIQSYDGVLAHERINKSPTFMLDALYLKGMGSIYLGRFDKTQEILETMERLPYKSIKGILLRSAKDLAIDNPLSAEQALIQIKKDLRGINLLVGLIILGDAYRASGKKDKAIETYRTVLEIDALNASAYYGIAKTYLSFGQKENALAYLMKCLQIEPQNVFAFTDLSDIFLISGDYDKAFMYAEKALTLKTPFYKPALAMANVLLIKGHDIDAEKWYQEAINLDSPKYLIPFSKARVYLISKNEKKANFFLRQSLTQGDIPVVIKNKIESTLNKGLKG